MESPSVLSARVLFTICVCDPPALIRTRSHINGVHYVDCPQRSVFIYLMFHVNYSNMSERRQRQQRGRNMEINLGASIPDALTNAWHIRNLK